METFDILQQSQLITGTGANKSSEAQQKINGTSSTTLLL